MNKQEKSASKLLKLRQEAELLLKKNKNKPLSEYENLKLIHELEVHQIELEMQNEELKLAKEKAELAETKYTELYEFAPSGYVTLTKEGEIVNLNKNAEGLLGKDRSNLIKGNFGFFVSDETKDVYNRFLGNIFMNKIKETCEFKMETGDDSMKYIYASGIISNIEEVCLVTLVDITKRKLAENELIKAKDKAEENERLKSSFLANMSHEIRTPMNGILGFADLLKTLKLNSEEQQEYIAIIQKSGVRMLNILNDIISISKIDSHQVELSFSDTNVNEQIEFIYSFFKLEAAQKHLQLSFNVALPRDEAYIRTDREKLYAILTNLVKNAIKFTHTGSIELGYTLKGDFLEFFVKDSGPGIPDEQKGIIFERFRQGSESFTRKYEGAGLGLSISEAYVEMLGGKIWVENNEGDSENALGAIFLFTIPLHPAQEAVHISPIAPGDKSTKNLGKKLHILIAEDDEFSKILLVKMVEGFSEKIITVNTGVEAIITLRKNPDIDLVLMDIHMPVMDGYEATRRIREFNKEVIIIAQTGLAMDGDREKSIAAGCNDTITKPLNGTELLEMVKLFIGSQYKIVNGIIKS